MSAFKPTTLGAEKPQITCPNCNSLCYGLKDACEMLPPVHPTKFNQLPTTAPSKIEDVGPVVLTWRVSPCGCQVSQEWVSAYAKELTNRKLGHPAQVVVAMTSEELAAKKQRLERDITQLYKAVEFDAEHGAGPTVVRKHERDLVVKVDELMKLCPGPHNKKIKPINLMQETIAWMRMRGVKY